MSERQPDLFTARPPTQSAPAGELDDARQRIVDCLGPAPTPVDDVIRDCQVTAASAQVVLLELEVAGRLTRLPGNKVALIADIEQPA
jgi:DNA processing protein